MRRPVIAMIVLAVLAALFAILAIIWVPIFNAVLTSQVKKSVALSGPVRIT